MTLGLLKQKEKKICLISKKNYLGQKWGNLARKQTFSHFSHGFKVFIQITAIKYDGDTQIGWDAHTDLKSGHSGPIPYKALKNRYRATRPYVVDEFFN